MRNTERVILDAVARGRTTVLTAEPIAAITIAAPAITARILSPSTARWYARVGYSTAAGTGSLPRFGGSVDLVGVCLAWDESVGDDGGGQEDRTGDQDGEMEPAHVGLLERGGEPLHLLRREPQSGELAPLDESVGGRFGDGARLSSRRARAR